jgi:hypothetical protein
MRLSVEEPLRWFCRGLINDKLKTIMKTNRTIAGWLMLPVLLTLNLQLSTAAPMLTAFSYQGRLFDGTNPANGSYDFVFTPYDSLTNGTAVGGPITNAAVIVTNGLFTTPVDFGQGIFNGDPRYLGIYIKIHTNIPPYMALSPRQLITPVPYSLYAPSAGTAAIAVLATNFSGSVGGDVSGSQGATVVTSVGGQTAASVALGVSAANSATSSNVPNSLVERNGSGDFSAGSLTLGGALNLPFPAVIYSGSNTVFVEQGNTFLGKRAGQGAAAEWMVGVGDDVLSSSLTGPYNTAIGQEALQYNTSGFYNTAGGSQALNHNTIGSANTAMGAWALQFNTNGSYNMGIGEQALQYNTSGYGNTAMGALALVSNKNGSYNTAIGWQALQDNTTGSYNTANGNEALYYNTTASYNTANGNEALYYNTNGSYNTANGNEALYYNTNGSYNTANGNEALYYNTTGSENTAIGFEALLFNTTGSYNTANGNEALLFNTIGNENTAIGFEALLNNSSGNNIALGSFAGYNITTGDNNIAIGNMGVAGDNNTIRVGVQGTQTSTYVAGIWGTSLGTEAQTVVVDSAGHLGTGAAPVSGVISVTGSGDITAGTTSGNVVGIIPLTKGVVWVYI